MMSRSDFMYKQLIFYRVLEKEKLSFRADNIVIEDSQKQVKLQHSCHRILALFIIGNITVTSVLLRKAFSYGFPIFLLNSNFHLDAVIGNHAEGNTLLRKRQYCSNDRNPVIAAELIRQKIRNQSQLLRNIRNASKIDRIAADGLLKMTEELPPDRDGLMGREGCASRLFFRVYFRHLGWRRRLPRCRPDINNLLLDIGYTYLFNLMESLLAVYGFDLYCGVYHTFFYQRKSLVCDMIEPFRCIIDHRLRKAHALNQINTDDFFFDKDHWELKYTFQMKYIGLFVKDLLERKEEMFLFVRKYYLWYMRDETDVEKFPIFNI